MERRQRGEGQKDKEHECGPGLAVTRVNPNATLTARVLDKANSNAALYERSVVDTPNVDRTLTQTELEAASGMHLHTGADVGAPITSGTSLI